MATHVARVCQEVVPASAASVGRFPLFNAWPWPVYASLARIWAFAADWLRPVAYSAARASVSVVLSAFSFAAAWRASSAKLSLLATSDSPEPIAPAATVSAPWLSAIASRLLSSSAVCATVAVSADAAWLSLTPAASAASVTSGSELVILIVFLPWIAPPIVVDPPDDVLGLAPAPAIIAVPVSAPV